MMRNIRLTFALLALMAVATNLNAQIHDGNAYLKNDYIQAALSPDGVYGATAGTTICPGYYSPANASSNGPLGFIASPDNNWPFYYGDFMLPGAPYEGFAITFKDDGGVRRQYENNRDYGPYQISPLVPAFVYNSNTSAGVYDDVTWYGQAGSDLLVECRFQLVGRRIIHYTKMKNISGTTLTDIYFTRGLDPDQENGANSSGLPPGCYGTTNTYNVIESQADGTPGKHSWVVATGYCTPSAISLYCEDTNSRAGISADWYQLLRNPEYAFGIGSPPNNLYLNEGEYSRIVAQDWTIELAIFVGDLDPDDSVTLIHEIRLDQPPVVYFDNPLTISQNEGTTFTYNLIRQHQLADTVTATVRLTGVSNALAGDFAGGVSALPHDYVVVFEPDSTTKTVTVTTSQNCRNVNKTFQLQIVAVSSVYGGMATMPSVATGTIQALPPTYPPTVTDSMLTYRQYSTAPSLISATGTSAAAGHTLQWYLSDTTTTYAGAGSPINTSATGVQTYFVSQISNTTNCESAKIPISLTIDSIQCLQLWASDTTTSDGCIILNWEWITPPADSYGFTLFQWDSTLAEWQTTSTNYDKTIQVLNVYPNIAGSNTLATWMHDTTIGLGRIIVTPVTIANFNANPDSYLKNASGEYQYDAVMFGSWDANNSQDLNATSSTAVRNYLNSGRGVLFGHDTQYGGHPYFASLADKTNMHIQLPYTGALNRGSTNVQVVNDGFLLKYPHIIPYNSILTIPLAHSTEQFAKGIIWMNFPNTNGATSGLTSPVTIVNGGTNDHYLSTWNNAAMIQTGHSSGASTLDERKVIANTLWYLAQFTTDTTAKICSARDLAAPEAPIASKDTNDCGKIDMFSFDYGSMYTFYVKATNTTDYNDTCNSNILTVENKSGLMGFYILEDTASTAIPDTAAAKVFIAAADSVLVHYMIQDMAKYVHIQAVDSAGNLSAVVTFNPIPNLTYSNIALAYLQYETAPSLLSATGASALTGYTLQWYLSDTTTVYTDANNPIYTDTLGIQTFFVSQINDTSGCESNKIPILVMVLKPQALNYFVCPNEEVILGVDTIAGVDFYWYDVQTGGTTLTPLPTDTFRATGTTFVQIFWVEARIDTIVFSRIPIEITPNHICGGIEPRTDCSVDGTLLYKQDFGGNNVSDPLLSPTGLPPGSTELPLFSGGKGYALTKNPGSFNPDFYSVSDHTYPNDTTRGYMLFIDPDYGDLNKILYQADIDNLCAGTTLLFTGWFMDVNFKIGTAPPIIQMQMMNKTTGDIIATTGDITIPKGNVWLQYGFNFELPASISNVNFKIINRSNTSSGNDWAMDDIEIRFCAPPVVLTPAVSDTNICIGSSITLNGTYTDDGTFGNTLSYRWQHSLTGDRNDPNAWTTLSTSTTTSPLSVNYLVASMSDADTGYYRLLVGTAASIDSSNCRSVSEPIGVWLNPLPVISISGTSNICIGTTTQLFPTTGGTWQSTNATAATVTNSGVVTGQTVGTTQFIFTSDTTGCSDTTSIVTVGEFPTVADIVATKKVFCIGESITLSNDTLGGVWTSSNHGNVTIGTPVGNSVTIIGVLDGKVYMTYTVTDSSGHCQTNKTILLKVVPATPPDIKIGFEE